MTLAIVHGAVMIAGCTAAPPPEPAVRTVTVKEPVYIRPEPPAWLTAPLFDNEDVPDVFVAPDDPDVVLGVTRQGLESFWDVIDRSVGRIEAWEAWAGESGSDSSEIEATREDLR